MSFDQDEKRISDALETLASELIIPDLMSGIQKKLDWKSLGIAKTKSKRIRKPFRIGLLAAIVVVMGFTAAAISLGGFDWMLGKVSPPFGNVVDAIEQSSISQGIKATVVAAHSYNNMAVLYLTLEDTDGLGRVTEDIQLDFVLNSQVQSVLSEMLFFDTETGIAAFQLRLDVSDTLNVQSFSLQLEKIFYGKTDLGEIRTDIDLSKAIIESDHSGEKYSSDFNMPSIKQSEGYLADILGTETAWVSAIEMKNGYLSVLFGKNRSSDIYYNIRPFLLDTNEDRIEAEKFASRLSTNDQQEHFEELKEDVYDFMECYFTVNTADLNEYALCFQGFSWNVITGEWNMSIDFDKISEVQEATVDIIVDDIHIFDVALTISPLGMTLKGSDAQDIDFGELLKATMILETTDGDIELRNRRGSRSDPNGPYELHWSASSAIDVDSVTAFRIGNNRITLK